MYDLSGQVFFQFSICNKVVRYKKNIAELVTWKIINMSAHNELIALPSCMVLNYSPCNFI